MSFTPLGRDQAAPGIVRRRQPLVHQRHHLLVGVRTRDAENLRVALADLLRTHAQAAGDDDPAVGVQRLTDGLQRLLHRRVDETAGVDDDQLRLVIAGHQPVSLRAQLGEDALRVHQVLGTAEADKADGKGPFVHCLACLSPPVGFPASAGPTLPEAFSH